MTLDDSSAARSAGISPARGKLCALRCATIVCNDLDRAVELYQTALGLELVETGTLDADTAKAWDAEALANAKMAVLQPASAAPTYLRFLEDKSPASTPPAPYASLGWTALEYSVKSSDAAIERLSQHGFRVLGPAEDLDFSEGALRAGQVVGPFGEILYLTQINRQLENFTLPEARNPVECLFIAVLVVGDVGKATAHYQAHFGAIDKGAFEAQVGFIAGYCGLPEDHVFQFGCVETVPESYIEIDAMPGGVPQRERLDQHLPAGISIVSFTAPSIEPFLAAGAKLTPVRNDIIYAGGRSILLTGQSGELIEIIETPPAHSQASTPKENRKGAA